MRNRSVDATSPCASLGVCDWLRSTELTRTQMFADSHESSRFPVANVYTCSMFPNCHATWIVVLRRSNSRLRIVGSWLRAGGRGNADREYPATCRPGETLPQLTWRRRGKSDRRHVAGGKRFPMLLVCTWSVENSPDSSDAWCFWPCRFETARRYRWITTRWFRFVFEPSEWQTTWCRSSADSCGGVPFGRNIQITRAIPPLSVSESDGWPWRSSSPLWEPQLRCRSRMCRLGDSTPLWRTSISPVARPGHCSRWMGQPLSAASPECELSSRIVSFPVNATVQN